MREGRGPGALGGEETAGNCCSPSVTLRPNRGASKRSPSPRGRPGVPQSPEGAAATSPWADPGEPPGVADCVTCTGPCLTRARRFSDFVPEWDLDQQTGVRLADRDR